MLFNSFEFIFIFLPSVFFVYFGLIKLRFSKLSILFLAFASLIFYSYYNVLYLPIILGSIIFNYAISNIINKNKKILFLGITANLLLLGYFKYTNFLIQNINYILDQNIQLVNIALPLAISFFTFQQIAFLIDNYHNKKRYNFFDYTLFISFFPQLIAGPIVHHKEMMPQFLNKNNLKINYENISKAIYIFSIGLFKKVVIADNLAIIAINGFDNTQVDSVIAAWTTSLSYTFELYFDFSGYCDMAIGAALLFNIKLPINFNSPYKSLNIQEFWRRWHISLGKFLKDYVYMPLGGNKKKTPNTYFNLFAVFLLGGIWHGAGWGFIIWGTLHGLAQIFYRSSINIIKIPKIISWLITFLFINTTWVFFRAKDFATATHIIKTMFGINANIGNFLDKKYEIISIIICFIICIFMKNSNELTQNSSFRYKAAFFIATLIVITYISSLSAKLSPFLYFNF
ncbi:MBOAT family protein [Campylobacter sp. 19-13652]|uniref:MBOAT family O-acyltransferase n=1 Tax=Campylobacter sp. 19-13652 TaxID=2840180 RepID=UPI001C76B434|nr:MBOAT family O-acyltransferase [Campylobacter sp. 19-13652]BCX78763.1 peptidoglycan O-acetyltransferase [Campylobacter sp. 19-13652]